MVNINDYKEEKYCIYKGEEYLVRDNGAVLRKSRPNQRVRKLDNEWTFGKPDIKTGYLEIASVRVHRIVALAFHGEPPTKEHIVDHIDTNRQNNRPTNLRWITRLENVVLNEVTRKRIEYRTGVSIYEFLENPAKYRDAFEDPDFSWMRCVTEEEAKVCLTNVRKWSEDRNESSSKQGSKLGEWIYQPQYNQKKSIGDSNVFIQSLEGILDVIDSLTPMAKQKDWKTPTKFVCCPEKVDGDPILCYLKNLCEGAIFTENRYGKSTIVKYALVNNEAIVIITAIPSSIKPLALVKVTYENGYYMHTSLGSFFTDEGAEKQFILAQGLEWTGGDSIDDYC
jgi:hypothetical protein